MNRLADQTSPYLRQHADNPVDWYPWGPDAFAAARLRDVPILLSIGYSACHWCHVMAHESFEDPATAAVMNAGFVNIKVDREERPDVDAIYMEAVQAVTGSGGWPMTVFLLPDGRPFLGGTYFPRDRFVELLGQVSRAWRQRRPDLDDAATRLADAVRAGTALPGRGWASQPATAGRPARAVPGPPGRRPRTPCSARFDAEWGGFGRAPKFPQPTMLELLLLAASRTGRADVAAAADHHPGRHGRRRHLRPPRRRLRPLLDRPALAGAPFREDALRQRPAGPGLPARLAADRGGPLPPGRDRDPGLPAAPARAPCRAVAWPRPRTPTARARKAASTCGTEAEVLEVGGRAAAEWYGVTAGELGGPQHPVSGPLDAPLARPPEVEAARPALFARRDARVRPGLDDKVLTEWNAMAVAALAEAGRPFADDRWLRAGEDARRLPARPPAPARRRALAAQLAGRYRRRRAPATARHLAYAADYAWLVEAFTRLAEATGRARWIAAATAPPTALLDLFGDGGSGVFHMTGDDAEPLIARPIDTQDGAVPSANSVAATALLRLAALTGADRYRDQAEAIIDAMSPALAAAPVAFTGLVAAADLARTGLTEVVVTGDRPDLLDVVRPPLPARGRAGLGRALPVAPVGRPDRARSLGSGLRLPGLRLPGPDGRSRTLASQLAADSWPSSYYDRQAGHPPVGVLDWQL